VSVETRPTGVDALLASLGSGARPAPGAGGAGRWAGGAWAALERGRRFEGCRADELALAHVPRLLESLRGVAGCLAEAWDEDGRAA